VIAAFFVSFKVGFQKIREKEQFHYQEQNNQLDDYNCPQFLSDCHTTESMVIKQKNIPDKMHNK
jgi:hypothetical protein